MPLPRAGDYAPASQDVVVLVLRIVRRLEAAAVTAAGVSHPLAMMGFASLNPSYGSEDMQRSSAMMVTNVEAAALIPSA
jgi:hypothetical protein